MKKLILNNGVEMPQIGYGVYQISPQECERSLFFDHHDPEVTRMFMD